MLFLALLRAPGPRSSTGPGLGVRLYAQSCTVQPCASIQRGLRAGPDSLTLHLCGPGDHDDNNRALRVCNLLHAAEVKLVCEMASSWTHGHAMRHQPLNLVTPTVDSPLPICVVGLPARTGPICVALLVRLPFPRHGPIKSDAEVTAEPFSRVKRK